mgnify:CR=1 FL=1
MRTGDDVRFAYTLLLWFTAITLYRRAFYRQFPGFFVYLSLSCLSSIGYAAEFNPGSQEWWFWHWLPWQPLLIAGLVLSMVELFVCVSMRILAEERRPLIGLCASLAFAMVCVSIRPAEDLWSAVRLAAELRRYVDIAATTALATGVACFWIRPLPFDRNTIVHALTLTLFLASCTAAEVWPMGTVFEWRFIDTLSYAACSGCLVSWVIFFKERRETAHVEGHP